MQLYLRCTRLRSDLLPDRDRPTPDITCWIKRANGQLVRIQAGHEQVHRGKRLVRVTLVHRFKRISQVRLPDGCAIHVANASLAEL